MKTPEGPLIEDLVFLKLGGSLITDKFKPRTPRPSVLERLADEIKASLNENPGLKILLGHGSGSYGHTSGKKYQTRDGVTTSEQWLGFTEVWQDAADLNHLVMTALRKAGLPAVGFPPSATIQTHARDIVSWDMAPIRKSLDKGLIPVVFGDVVFDESLGGTILSTEDLFVHLARHFNPQRILLAGQDPGVWKDFPTCKELFRVITPADKMDLENKVDQSRATDVTGGMGDKVSQMLDLISASPSLQALIFSGAEKDHLRQALVGNFPSGTKLQI